ncbi:hypothetical protein GDO81_008136 [Engystomops pustulosus]|uniref:Uncharacterized protein n=1 Tax=Engystomops pustulosus TaxID=76066 RepID=A0AAV7CD83_ENGPU|nr:hypothetical protein GDO81_008136 [Engystomops pustulosus]
MYSGFHKVNVFGGLWVLCITKSDQYKCCSFTMSSRAGKMDQGNAVISPLIDEMAVSNICFLSWTLSDFNRLESLIFNNYAK